MKKTICNILIISFVFSFLIGCSSSGSEGDKRVVAEVNNYRMTVEDLRYELKNIPYDRPYLLETEEGRMRYINSLLEKEILLQEAQRQGIDKEKDFMKSIENYWEQALLKLSLEREAKRISGSIHVYDNEIEEYYKNSGEQLALPEVKRDIARLIRQKKEMDLMNAWIEELKEQSDIKINRELLEEVISDN